MAIYLLRVLHGMHNRIPARAYGWWINRKRESGSVAQAQGQLSKKYAQIRRTANWFRGIPWFLFPGLRSNPNQESQTTGFDVATLNLGACTYSSTTGIPSTDQALASIMPNSVQKGLWLYAIAEFDWRVWHLTAETSHTFLTVYVVNSIHPGGWFFIFALSALGRYRKMFCIDSRRSWQILNWVIHWAVLAVFLQVFIESESKMTTSIVVLCIGTCMALAHHNRGIGVTIDILIFVWYKYDFVMMSY